MGAEVDKAGPPVKLSIVVFSGTFERVHYALATAAAASAVARPVTLFFTMEAIRALARDGAGDSFGWRTLAGAEERDRAFAAAGVVGFEELLSACASLRVRFMVCDMGLRVVGLKSSDLRDDLAFEEGGIVSFLNDARADGAMLFV